VSCEEAYMLEDYGHNIELMADIGGSDEEMIFCRI
jgi:hypothetical protein